MHDPPVRMLPDAVAVDLALDLEAAVVSTDLDCGAGGGPPARADPDLVGAPGLCGRGHRDAGRDGDGDCGGFLDVKLHDGCPLGWFGEPRVASDRGQPPLSGGATT